MTKRARPDCRRPCSVCGKLLKPQGHRVHLLNTHGITAGASAPAPAPESPPADVSAPRPAAAVDPEAPAAPPADPLAAPAIDPAGLAALGAAEPAAPPLEGGEAPKPGAAVVHSREDVGRAMEGLIRQGDRVASKLLGVPEEKPAELDHIVHMMRPGAERIGDRLGAGFWLLAFIVGVLSWLAYKVAAARERRLQLSAGPAPSRRPAPTEPPPAEAPPPHVPELHNRVSPLAS